MATPAECSAWTPRALFELPADHPARDHVHQLLERSPSPTARELASAGLVAPHWPPPWGLDATPVEQLVIDDELKRRGLKRPVNSIGIGWAGPTILTRGNESQRERYLMPLLSGDEIWCQLFSEPEAGSDLASLRTTAVKDGDELVVTGEKVWTTFAHQAKFGILLARTSTEKNKHAGITYIICPMDLPGVQIEPIVDLTGTHEFNSVFLDEVRIPIGNVVGNEGEGWELARVTLANERVSLSSGGVLWGTGPDIDVLLGIVRENGPVLDANLRQRLASLYSQAKILRIIRESVLSDRIRGQTPGPEASIQKLMADIHGQEFMALAKDLAGPFGMLSDAGPFAHPGRTWNFAFLFSRALTIGGGTAEVQRNILAERLLGLPRDP